MPRGPAGVEREDEVVGVGDVVRDDAEPVQPRVADLAAGEQPAVARHGLPRRKASRPPAGAVRLRLRCARLPVLDPADGNGLDVLRHADAHDRFTARLVGALEHVEIRAVVVRLVEQRHGRLDLHRAHPFTEPAVRPETM